MCCICRVEHNYHNQDLPYSLEARFSARYSRNLVRMFFLMLSQASWKFGVDGFRGRSLGKNFENAINFLANKPWFLCVCIKSQLKTLWEKEKLLVTSNFSFSHSVFYPFGELSAIFINFRIVVYWP